MDHHRDVVELPRERRCPVRGPWRRSGAAGAAAGLVLCLLVVGLALQACSPAAQEDIAIGVIVPTSGSIAVWGINSERGIRLAAEQINAAGGIDGRKLRLLVEDSACQPERAVASFQRLVTEGQVPVVLGNICSSNVLAMAPLAEQEKVVLFSTGASNPAISEAGDFVFRNWPSDHLQGSLTADYAYEQGYRKMAILHVDNDYGGGLEEVFRRHFQELGGTITLTPSASYTEGDDDFAAQIAQIDESGADALYLPAYTREYPLILAQLEEAGVDWPIIASETFDDPDTIQSSGTAAEEIVFPSPAAFDRETAQGEAFAQAFESRFGEPPGITADTAFDAMNILAEALAAGAHTGPAIRDFLYQLHDYEGVAGATTFDARGDATKRILFYEISDGRAWVLE